jgi:glyoxylase-like metal-dependent hydrolase (beta-lactamase superfamily II)
VAVDVYDKGMNLDIRTIDLTFQNVPRAIASYLVVTEAGPVLVETGPASTHTALVAGLANHGYTPADIRHVFVTHIHLDHAGAAGHWAQQGAQIYVHHLGAPHLIDPSRLLRSAQRIYGDLMATLWGEIVPAPADRVTTLHDGDLVQIGSVTFQALDTPGHANHHHVYRVSDVAFTGDAAGVHLPDSSFTALPAPPPEFDREVWLHTIDRLLAEAFTAIYPTHFGRIDNVSDHWRSFRALISEATEFVGKQMAAGREREEIVTRYLAWNEQRAVKLGVSERLAQRYEVANPNFMSVDGIMRYWQKKR